MCFTICSGNWRPVEPVEDWDKAQAQGEPAERLQSLGPRGTIPPWARHPSRRAAIRATPQALQMHLHW